jgi:ribosome-binding factor A
MSHRTRRTERVDELLKQEIARVLGDLKDPRVGFATVMDVRTSPDLRHAKVFVSVLGTEEEKQLTLAALAGARGFVRARVGEKVTLKYLPELHFELDRTLEQAARIEEILDSLEIEDREEEGDGEVEGEERV